MKRVIYFLTLFFCFASCNTSAEKKETAQENVVPQEPFQLYKKSEMASFMQEMYKGHKEIKKKILKGEAVDSLPYNLLQLHTARLTDSTDYDEDFKNAANIFIEFEQKIISEPSDLKKNYNQAVNLCISCHQLKCRGPIPRIKRLKIK
jgi:hypothetical protein